MEQTASFFGWKKKILSDGDLLRQLLLCLLMPGAVRMVPLPVSGEAQQQSIMLFLCVLFVLAGAVLSALGRKPAGRILPAVVFLVVFLAERTGEAGAERAVHIVLPALILYWISCAALRLGSFFAVPVYILAGLIVFGYARGTMPDALTLCAGLPLLLSELRGIRDHQSVRWLGAFLAFSLLVTALPVHTEPIDWSRPIERAQELFYEAGEKLDRLTYHFSERLPQIFPESRYRSGYSGLGTAGEKRDAEDREELVLHTAGSRITIYLVGQTYDRFEDGRLVHSGKQEEAAAAEDLSSAFASWLPEYLTALYRAGISREEARTFSEPHTMDVEYRLMQTRDLIRDRSTFRTSVDPKELEVTDQGIRFDARHGMGTTYETAFLVVDYANPLLEEILRGLPGTSRRADAPSYEEMCEYFSQLYGGFRNFRLENLLSEADYESWRSGEEPVRTTDAEIPERIRALAEQITAGMTSDYDKARAIEQYLRSNYRYTLYPAAPADGKQEGDYVEQFLFATGEGYCVHYAAAMLQMLQAVGIEARYCEGYACRIPVHGVGEYQVMSSRAHAWPEAYFAGFGWVPFEPTSALPSAADTTWNRTVKEESGESEEEEDAVWQNPYALPEAEAELPEPEEEPLTAHPLFVPLLTVLILALGIPLYLLIFVLIRRRLRRRRYRQLDARERLLMQETEIRELLGKLDPEPVNPVLTDYAARLPDSALSADLRAFTDCYEAVRFGAKSVLPSWTSQAEKLRAALAERWIAADPDSTLRKWIRRAQIRISRRTFEEE